MLFLFFFVFFFFRCVFARLPSITPPSVFFFPKHHTYLAVGRQRHHVARQLVDRVAVGGDALPERFFEALVVAGGVDCGLGGVWLDCVAENLWIFL